MADTTYRGYGTLRWPLTPSQLSEINDEFERIYRLLRAGVGGGSGGATLSPSGVTAGTYGSASKTVTETVNEDGILTAAADQDIAIDASQITTGTISTARLPSTTTVVACSLYNSTAQTLTHGVEATLTFDSEDYDATNLHSTSSNTSRITIPANLGSVFTFKARVKFTTAFAGVVHLRLYQNGSLVTENTASGADLSSGNEYHEISADISAAATDYFEVKVLVELAAGSGTINTASGTGNTQFQARSAAAFSGAVAGKIAQVVNTETGAVATGSTTIPIDDTIPQSTEGDQYMSLAITPTSATNKLKIEIVAFLTPSVSAWVQGALFQDSGANALAAFANFTGTATAAAALKFTHYMTAGTTSATTFKFRAGLDRAGTTTFNGQSGARRYGGVMASSITITEIVP